MVANVGWMPTATAYAAEVLGTAEPVRALLTLENAELVEGELETELGVLPGVRGGGPEIKTLRWRVCIIDPSQSAGAKVTAVSEKAGTARKQVVLTAGSL
jgi:hypothetical protein